MIKIDSKHIPAQNGIAFTMKAGQIVRVIDPEGGQVADFTAFLLSDHCEKLSTNVTLDNNMSIFIKKGDSLFSNKYRKLLTITEDTVGKHDMLFPAYSPGMYQYQYNINEYHPSCWENLSTNLQKLGVNEELPTPFGFFQNSQVTPDGKIKIEAPLTKPGDYLDLRAEVDLIIAVSACSVKESACNSFKCSPVEVEIYEM